MSKTNVYRFSEYRLDTKKNNKKVGNTEGRKIMNIIIDYVHGHSELASVMTSVLYKLRYTDYPMENEEIIAVSNAAVTATQEGNEQAAIILENFVSMMFNRNIDHFLQALAQPKINFINKDHFREFANDWFQRQNLNDNPIPLENIRRAFEPYLT